MPEASGSFCDHAARRPSGEIDASWNPRTFSSDAKTVSIAGGALALGAARIAVSRSAEETMCSPLTATLSPRRVERESGVGRRSANDYVRSTQMLLTCVYSSSA